MCGICGKLVWDQKSPVDSDLLKRMNRSITHRGPDDEGYFEQNFSSSATAGSIGLAMRRLAIIDLTSGKQPIFNETNDVVVVYNGETYNFKELRSELIDLGHKFKTQTDTEVLVHAYETWGDDMPSKLNGMFGFAIWDLKRRRLLLVRDRMGIKPVYYALTKNKLVFASEIKSILEDPEVSREIDPLAVHDFLSMRYIPTPRSIYRSIRKLEPATALIWDKGKVQFKRYWDYKPSETKDLGLKTYMEKTEALLADSVKRQMISDVPLGTFLSGGVDSPTISYFAKQAQPDLMTFTIFFSERSFSEREEAKLVAEHLGTNHIEEEVHADIHSLIPELVDIFDEPFADDSMIPTYFLTKMARQKMTVALSGDGGDELFGGYPTYIADRLAGFYRRVPNFLTKSMIEPIVHRLPVSYNRLSLDYKAKAFIRAANRPSPLEHFGWTEIFDPSIKEGLYSQEFKETARDFPLADSFVNAYKDGASRPGLERFLYVDQRTHLLDEFLVKVDRLSMAHSLEVRPPFLDHRLVELAAEIPIHHKIRGKTTKYILRRLMKGRLPEPIISGAKKGFSPPMATWLAKDLYPYAKKKLSEDWLRSIPFINPEFPIRLLQDHVNKRQNSARRLWTLLMLIEWYDRKVLGRE